MEKSHGSESLLWDHDRLQQECFLWSWNERLETRRCLFAVPNGGKRSKAEANRLKGTGVIRGASDLCFYWRGRFTIFEIKVGRDYLKPDQIKFRDVMVANGAVFYEIRSVEQFKVIFDQIIQRNA